MSILSFTKMDFRKFRIVLAAGIFAITLACYYLFSYFQQKQQDAEAPGKSAFNTELPAPKLDEKYKNKLDLYMEARQDSLRELKEARQDSLMFPEIQDGNASGAQLSVPPVETPRPIRYDANEVRMERALAQLQAALSNTAGMPAPVREYSPESTVFPGEVQGGSGADLAQLEKQLAATAAFSTEDLELKRMDGMLDKILEIRQPGRRSANNANAGDTTVPLRVSVVAETPYEPTSGAGNGFFGISGDEAQLRNDVPPGNGTIRAVVHGEQKVRTGSTVRLRLLQDIYINNARIPANTSVFGTATVDRERVQLEIRHAVHAGTVLPVKLSVFDIDGIAGISAPGADARDAGRQGINQAVQDLELYSMDPSVGAQAAASGIQAAKSLLSKKTRTPYATLKANHTVMLVNAHN